MMVPRMIKQSLQEYLHQKFPGRRIQGDAGFIKIYDSPVGLHQFKQQLKVGRYPIYTRYKWDGVMSTEAWLVWKIFDKLFCGDLLQSLKKELAFKKE